MPQLSLGCHEAGLALAAVRGQGAAARQVAAQGVLCLAQLCLALLQGRVELLIALLQLRGLSAALLLST